jgi:hypothetical protein
MLVIIAILSLHNPHPRFRKPRYRLPITRKHKRKGQP